MPPECPACPVKKSRTSLLMRQAKESISVEREPSGTGARMITSSSQVYQLKHQHLHHNWRKLVLSLLDFVIFVVLQLEFCCNCPNIPSLRNEKLTLMLWLGQNIERVLKRQFQKQSFLLAHSCEYSKIDSCQGAPRGTLLVKPCQLEPHLFRGMKLFEMWLFFA